MLRVAISGCNGKMGKAVSDICRADERITVVAGFDIFAEKLSDFPVYADPMEFSGSADVIIDFSNPASLDTLLPYCLRTKTPVVLATTGHSPAQLDAVAESSKTVPVFRSANMSLGVNLIKSLAVKAASVLRDSFDIEIIEKHHNQKIDAPSGTALILADAVKNAVMPSAEYTYDRHLERRKRDPNEIGIHAVRGGTIVGEHSIIFAGRDEIIEIKHSALSREVFAAGAVRAAKFLSSCSVPRIYTMDDLITE